MTPKEPEWIQQGKVDLMYLRSLILEITGVLVRIDKALNTRNEDAYNQAIDDWVGQRM